MPPHGRDLELNKSPATCMFAFRSWENPVEKVKYCTYTVHRRLERRCVASNGGAIRGSGGAAKRTSILEFACWWCRSSSGWHVNIFGLLEFIWLGSYLHMVFIAEREVDIRGSVAMPSDVVLTAGSSSSLGICFCCCVRFVSSASQAVALRQISSSVAIGSWTFAHDRIWPPQGSRFYCKNPKPFYVEVFT